MKKIALTQGKICPRCKLNKNLVDFNRCNVNKDRVQTACRLCQKKYRENHLEIVRKNGREYMRKIRLEKPEEVHKNDRRLALQKNYGITIKQYEKIFKKQIG